MPAKKARKRTPAQAAADRAEARSAATKARQAQAGNGAPAKESVKAKDVIKLPRESTIKSAATEAYNTKKRVGKSNDDLNKYLQDCKREKGLHPKALKDVVSLKTKALKSDKGLAAIATYEAHREHYMEVLGLNELIAKQGQMFGRTEAGETIDKTPAPAERGEGEERDLRPDALRHPAAQTPIAEGTDTAH